MAADHSGPSSSPPATLLQSCGRHVVPATLRSKVTGGAGARNYALHGGRCARITSYEPTGARKPHCVGINHTPTLFGLPEDQVQGCRKVGRPARAQSRMSVAHLSDVDAWRASAQRPTIAQQHVWGPVGTRIAALAGSARGAQSVCIAPHLPQMSVAAVLGCNHPRRPPAEDDGHC